MLIKIGIVGFDTSHCLRFTERVNHVGVPKEQWVEGARVTMGYPGSSTSFVSEEVISERTRKLMDFGVRIVGSAEYMIGKIDGILLEIQDGALHFRYAKPFIEARLPIFVDKPFTCSVSEARRLAELAQYYDVPIFSSSSLRYAVEVQDLKARKDVGSILGTDVYTPASLHPNNPGFFNYGIHGVEMLYSLMGIRCTSLRCIWDERWETIVGHWKDGRIGTVRGIRDGATGFGFTVFCEKGIVSSAINTKYIYRELLKKIIEMFRTGTPPLSIDETIEIIAFIEASLESSSKEGTVSTLIV